MIPGLDFVAIGQSTEMETINGRISSTSSVVYQVTPQGVGIYTIPAMSPSSQPQVLRVLPVDRGGTVNNSASAALPPAFAHGTVSGPTSLSADGAAFVRLRLPKHQLYVGESIPVDIQVGMREGLVASLNGLPVMNGDAFTLNKLSAKPDRTEEQIGGRPFTVLTWHSELVAVKPGSLSLRIETPLTVRMQSAEPTPQGGDDDSALGNMLNDPFFQDFFGGTAEKDVTVASSPATFTVLALPTQDRPPGFNGAVGAFKISSELSAPTAIAGDPLTLRLHVTGAGNFDRVNSLMLGEVDNWKTYAPTARFTPTDNAGFEGQKTFEQPVIASQAGTQTLPGIAFSFFDPDARRYETLHTPSLRVAVAAATGGPSAIAIARVSATTAAPLAAIPRAGLRADQPVNAATVSSLRPPYFQLRYLSIPSGLTLGIAGVWLWLRRREQGRNDRDARELATRTTAKLLSQMDRAAAAGDAQLFFIAARSIVQRTLSAAWHLPPEKLTLEEIRLRLGAAGQEILRLLALADEAVFSGCALQTSDSQRWKQVVHRLVAEGTTS